MTTENQIQKYDETLNSVADTLRTYADALTDENADLRLRVQELATKTTPAVKGIEAPQRVQLPRLLLRQPSSNSDKVPVETKAGQLYTSQSEHVGDELTFIPVYTHNIRVRWGDDDKVECQSLDGVTGNRYGECRVCPYGQFVRGERPQCSPGSTYYVVSEDLTKIYRIDFTKTSAKAGKNIRQLSLPPNMWSRVFSLGVEKMVTGKNTYYVLKTNATGARTSEDVSEVCDILFEYFNSNYKKMLLLQEEYAKRGASVEAASPAGALPGNGVVPNEEEINFSDSV